jgi:hypothetical protein
MSQEAQSCYARLLALADEPVNVVGAIHDQMLVLADALEENDGPEGNRLAHAYRWAAVRGRWPFIRWSYHSDKTGIVQWGQQPVEVYDWDGEHRAKMKGVPAVKVPEPSLLPEALYRAIIDLPWPRKYGDINDAFVLLGEALGSVDLTPAINDLLTPLTLYDVPVGSLLFVDRLWRAEYRVEKRLTGGGLQLTDSVQYKWLVSRPPPVADSMILRPEQLRGDGGVKVIFVRGPAGVAARG